MKPTRLPGAGVTRFRADFAEIRGKSLFTLRGSAEMERSRQRLLADLLSYDKASQRADAEGHVLFRQEGLLLTGQSGFYNLLTKTGALQDTTFRLEGRHARGAATRVRVAGDVARLHQASFTTCSLGNHDWYLRARDLRLDQGTATGQAWHALLEFKGLPVLYMPYLSFPLNDERRSGFLPPRYGTSNESGGEISVPYYWNIAPNQDATITPRLLTKRGLMLQGDYRYLYPSGHGQLDSEFLPYDRVFGGPRGLLSLRQVGDLAPRWHTDINANWVSDQNYLQQFANTLSIASIAYLERRADLSYYGSFWSVTGRVQNFQTLDETVPTSDRPYQRLPQLVFQAGLPPAAWPFEPAVRAELVRFERADSVTGQRLDLQPKLQFSWATQGGYVTPTLKAWHTSYLLDSTPSGVSQGPRTLPLFSLDSGAFFERPLLLQDRPLLQTLEPRLYYLYVPFQNQSQLPVFDTELGDLNFAQIFQDNRFTGADRVGDANQLTLGMTTRFLDRQTGVERLRASVGQIRYFEDRRVTLPGEPVQTSSASDLLGEVSARLAARWSARLQLQWNPATQGTDKASVNVRYEPSEHRIVNVAYRFVNPELNQTDGSGVMSGLDQTDMSVLWPIGDRWTIVGRWNYSFEDRRTLQSVFGFGYESCCWAVRIAAREYVKTSGGGTNKAVFMELELKGLTRFGNRIEDLLERGILGYERG